jgi:hypothetical protein
MICVVQSNKGLPAFWLAVSAFLVLMLHRLGHVARIVSAMSRTLFKAVGFLFVDDTDLFTVAKSKLEMPAQVTSRMQEAVDAWHGGLRTAGGAQFETREMFMVPCFFLLLGPRTMVLCIPCLTTWHSYNLLLPGTLPRMQSRLLG